MGKKRIIHWALLGAALFGATINLSELSAQDLTLGYSADKEIIRGSVVGLSEDDPTKVEAITDARIDDLFGVVVADGETALTLTGDLSGVLVSTSGRHEILVSDINGIIESGDTLTASPIEGIAMLSDPDHALLIGTALEEFDVDKDTSKRLTQAVAKDLNGNDVVVSIGRILGEVDVRPNPNASQARSAPKFLKDVASAITGEANIPDFRIYAALAVLVLSSGVAGSMLYSATRSALTAIGRNPLSKRSILVGLGQVGAFGVAVFLGGLVAVYLVLKL